MARGPFITPVLPMNTTILTFLTAGTPFANISVGVQVQFGIFETAFCQFRTSSDLIWAQGGTLAFFLFSNATVFMSGSFWPLANENVEEIVEASSGVVISKWKLFHAPKSGEVCPSTTFGLFWTEFGLVLD